jgi:pimeloyl-ACP methyl ester carboxylesterase
MPGLIELFALAAFILVVLFTLATVHHVTHPPRLTFGAAIGRGLPPSPAEVGFRFSEHLLRLASSKADGSPDATLAWLVQGTAPPSTAPAPIFVVTHSWGDSRYASARYLAHLAPLASFVLLYDTRGHGDSTPDACDLGTTEADDLLLILEQLPAILPADVADKKIPIVLFGASMGGGISIAAAAKSQAQNDGKPIVAVIGDSAYRRGMEPIDGFFRTLQYPVFPFHFTVGAWLTLRYTTDAKFDRARHAARLKCPLLLMHGAADRICPFNSAKEIAAAAPRATFIAFEDASHLRLIDRDAEKFRRSITEFLDSLSPE